MTNVRNLPYSKQNNIDILNRYSHREESMDDNRERQFNTPITGFNFIAKNQNNSTANDIIPIHQGIHHGQSRNTQSFVRHASAINASARGGGLFQ